MGSCYTHIVRAELCPVKVTTLQKYSVDCSAAALFQKYFSKANDMKAWQLVEFNRYKSTLFVFNPHPGWCWSCWLIISMKLIILIDRFRLIQSWGVEIVSVNLGIHDTKACHVTVVISCPQKLFSQHDSIYTTHQSSLFSPGTTRRWASQPPPPSLYYPSPLYILNPDAWSRPKTSTIFSTCLHRWYPNLLGSSCRLLFIPQCLLLYEDLKIGLLSKLPTHRLGLVDLIDMTPNTYREISSLQTTHQPSLRTVFVMQWAHVSEISPVPGGRQ